MNVFGRRTLDSRAVQEWAATLSVGKSIFDYYDSLGDVNISAPTTVSSTLDGPMVVYRCKSLTLSAALSLQYRCRGLMVLVDGDLTINSGGQIDVTGRGARGHAGMALHDLVIPDSISANSDRLSRRSLLKYIRKSKFAICDRWMWDDWGMVDGVSVLEWTGGTILLAASGCGGRSAPAHQANGAAGTNGGTGAGGHGSQLNTPLNCNGSGRPWGGGSGGPGVNGTPAISADDYGGVGGDATYGQNLYSAPGAGNPGGGPGNAGYCTAAQDGTGGILFIICKGNVTINSGGLVSANGRNGGGNTYAGQGMSGGGSGGGHISIIHGGTYANSGTVQASGGSGGLGAHDIPGGYGGAGSVVTKTFAEMGW